LITLVVVATPSAEVARLQAEMVAIYKRLGEPV
jgi:hypothetical protein